MNPGSSVSANDADHEISYFRFWALKGSEQGGNHSNVSSADSENISPGTTRPPTTRRRLPRGSTLSSSHLESTIGPANASKEDIELNHTIRLRAEDSKPNSSVDTPQDASAIITPKAARLLGSNLFSPSSLTTSSINDINANAHANVNTKPRLSRGHAYMPPSPKRTIYESIDQEHGARNLSDPPSPHQIVLPFCTITFVKSRRSRNKDKREQAPIVSSAQHVDAVKDADRASVGVERAAIFAPLRRHISNAVPTRILHLLKSSKKPIRALGRVQTMLSLKDLSYLPPKRVDTNDAVGNMLVRVDTVLHDFADLRQRIEGSSSKSDSGHGSNRSIASGQINHRASRSPMARPQFYYHAGNSESDSLQDINLHQPLQVTPDSNALYTGSDGQRYLKVDITSSSGPSYLPSEARRIRTPPLNESTGPNKRRGFFFDYNKADDSKPSTPRAFSPRPTAPRMHTGLRKDWYAALEAALEEQDDITQVEVDVPDHLPTSPLCPRHPKHKTKGKGICPMHGRNNSIGSAIT